MLFNHQSIPKSTLRPGNTIVTCFFPFQGASHDWSPYDSPPKPQCWHTPSTSPCLLLPRTGTWCLPLYSTRLSLSSPVGEEVITAYPNNYDTLPLDQAVSVHPLILSAKLPRVSLPRTASEDSAGKALTKTTGKRLKNRRALI